MVMDVTNRQLGIGRWKAGSCLLISVIHEHIVESDVQTVFIELPALKQFKCRGNLWCFVPLSESALTSVMQN